MKLIIIKEYPEMGEITIAVILRNKIYNKTTTYGLYGLIKKAFNAGDYKTLMGIIKRNRFVVRDYIEGVTTLYI